MADSSPGSLPLPRLYSCVLVLSADAKWMQSCAALRSFVVTEREKAPTIEQVKLLIVQIWKLRSRDWTCRSPLGHIVSTGKGTWVGQSCPQARARPHLPKLTVFMW